MAKIASHLHLIFPWSRPPLALQPHRHHVCIVAPGVEALARPLLEPMEGGVAVVPLLQPHELLKLQEVLLERQHSLLFQKLQKDSLVEDGLHLLVGDSPVPPLAHVLVAQLLANALDQILALLIRIFQ